MNKFYATLVLLKIGDRIVVPKSHLNLVQHHAIFLGYENGHYWFIENKDGIGVRVVNADVFFTNVLKITKIIPFYSKVGYTENDLVRYALSKKGKAYHLTKYNCEHFANEVQHKVIESRQANTGVGVALFGLALLLVSGLASSSGKRK